MKTVLAYFIVMFGLLAIQTTLFGQEEKQSGKKLLKYDDWPTIESNANIKDHIMNKSDGIAPNFVLIGRQWDRRIITYFFQNGTPDIAGNDEQNAIRAALAIWSNSTDLFFLEVCNQANADISFLFGAGNHGDPVPACYPGLGAFDGTNGTLAHNMGGPDPGNNCGNQGADVHFDEDENWTDAIQANGNQPIDLVTVAAHELGHALGLFHTTVAGSLMMANYTGSHRFLGADDIAGIRSLYGFPQTNIPITGLSPVCTGGTQYTLNNVPAGAAVTWTATPTNLFATNSGNGANATLAAAFSTTSAWGTLTFTVASGCGNPLQVQKTFWVGRAPAAEGIDIANIEDPMSLCPNTQYIVEAYWEWSPNMPPIIEYEWMLPSGWTSVEAGTQNPFTHDDVLIRVNAKSLGQPSFIRVRGKNECGSFGLPTFLYVDTECEPYFFSVYPNPVDNYLTVEIDKSEYKSFKFQSYEIVLLDNNGMEKFRTSTNDSSKRIDTSSLGNGQYFIQVLYKGEILQRQVIIKR